mmetsp:Transcript_79310/g.137514  ORF Transcript_79310/g.137514 Transcript_79310/m.137514 type:complete len:496 (-) Transcript_79310:114-1601(-)
MTTPRNRDDGTSAMRLDLESPRITAAMKVLGIDEKDLQATKVPEEAAKDSPRAEVMLRKQELMDRKRRQLIREIEMTADALDEDALEAILSPTSMESAEEVDLKELLDLEKKKIDSKRERVKLDLQKEISREMESKQLHEANQKSRDEWKKRLEEKQKGTKEEIMKRQDEKIKRDQKMDDKLKSVAKAEWQKRREMMKKLNETNERVSKQIADRKQMWADVQEERRKKMGEIAQKNLDFRMADEEEKLRKHERNAQREREREARLERLEEEAHQKKEDNRSKFSEKMQIVNDRLRQETQKKEKSFQENQEKWKVVHQQGATLREEASQKVRTARDKDFNKWQSNRNTQRRNYVERMKEMKQEVQAADQRSKETRANHLEESVYKKAEMRSYLAEVVEQNKARITRSDEYEREQMLAKIRATKNKIETHCETKKQIVNYRTNALRDEMQGRAQLQVLKSVVRDASTKRINQILKEFDMPLMSIEPAKEGEEGQQQQ